MRRSIAGFTLACVFALTLAPLPAPAQSTPPGAGSPAAAAETFTPAQLDQMVAPIALYPDALLSQVLMASTYPSDVDLAVAWAKAHQKVNGDDAVKAVESQPWDPSVQSLVAFPQVLAMMGAKPEWVQDLGDAFLADPNGVMNAVQRLRAKAQAAGHLESNQQQTIATEAAPPPATPPPANAPPPPAQIITIQPANPQIVYVPTYNPTMVYGAWPYPAYPPYYIPPPPGWGFAAGVVTAGIAWGIGIGVSNALWGGIRWGGYGGSQVNINVNRYNNINVNNHITNNNWTHNSYNRNGVPYRNGPARDQYGHNIPPRYNNDRLYSGRGDGPQPTQQPGQRDAQRERAEQTLSGRVGDQNMNRQALNNVDRNTLQNRGGGGQYGGGQRDFNSLNQASARGNYDNAFRGASNPAQTREQADRGAASRASMQQREPQARPQQAREQRPQQQRQPAARPQENRGGGGAARGGGGGGRKR